MYLYLKNNHINTWASVIGAFMVGLAPKIMGHLGAGHITLIFAFAWTPWLLFFIQSGSKKNVNFYPAGVILAFILLADIRWYFYAAILTAGYVLFEHLLGNKRNKIIIDFMVGVKETVNIILISLVLCLPYLLLIFQFSNLSTRSLMTVNDQSALALPLEALIGFIFPNMAGYAEWITYSSAFCSIGILEFLFTKKKKEETFWIIVLLCALIFSLGHPALFNILNKIPGMSLLRVPSRAILVGIICLSIISANRIDQIITQTKRERILLPFWYNLSLAGLCFGSIIITTGIMVLLKDIAIDFLWGTIALNIFLLLIITKDQQIFSGKNWAMIMVPVILLDILGVGVSQIRFVTYQEVMEQKEDITLFIKLDNKPGKIYSPSYSIPQQNSALNRIQMVDGINPLQIKKYVDFMAASTGVDNLEYSVTVPSFKYGNPQEDNRYAYLNTKDLGELSVRYVVSAFKVEQPALKFLKKVDNNYIYENLDYQPGVRMEINGITEEVNPVDYHAGYYSFTTNKPGRIIISDVDYPGWELFIDGKNRIIDPYRGFFLSVNVGEGAHEVVFKFLPRIMLWGFLISITGIILYGGCFVVQKRRNKMGY